MQVKGIISRILPQRSGVSQSTGNEWTNQEFILEYFWWPNQTLASKISFTLYNERIHQLDGIKEGTEVEINFHIETREYNGRLYNEVRCDLVKRVGGEDKRAAEQPQEKKDLEQLEADWESMRK